MDIVLLALSRLEQYIYVDGSSEQNISKGVNDMVAISCFLTTIEGYQRVDCDSGT